MPTRKAPARPRQPLTRARVLEVALALVDRSGVEALSMRQLAAKLGVEAMSLYHHVASKEDLLAGLVECVLGEIDVPAAGTPWREAMTARARSTRAVFLRHPGAAALIESCVSMTPTRLTYADRVIGLLLGGGFTVTQAYRGFLTLDSYVYGFTLQELSWPRPGAVQAADVTPPAFPAEAFPNFARVMVEVMGAVGSLGLQSAYDAEFEFGLELVLDGLERVRARAR